MISRGSWQQAMNGNENSENRRRRSNYDRLTGNQANNA